ncbi:MAG: hypothetical protein M3N32_08205 [Actinomycetota bacterium]|nr:hypothetical protein [Actinomycetota bacterium]
MSESHGDSPGAQEGKPSEDEVRAYLAQLRQAGVADIVAQAFSLLASGAEVKLGRRDARLLIDLAAAVADVGGPHLEERLRQQMQQALNQLRVGQVDAESQLAKLRAEGKLPPEEADDLPEGAAAASAGQASQTARQETPRSSERPSSAASRLWIPGR